MRGGSSLALLAALAPVAGSGQLIKPAEPNVAVEYDRERDFSKLRTYAWMQEQKATPNMANHIRLTVAIQKQLQKVGLSPDTREPEVRVLYSLDDHEKVEFDAVVQRSIFSNSPTRVFGSRPHRVQERALSILLADAETNAVLWFAAGTRVVESPDKEEQELNALVADLFSKYPKGKPKT